MPIDNITSSLPSVSSTQQPYDSIHWTGHEWFKASSLNDFADGNASLACMDFPFPPTVFPPTAFLVNFEGSLRSNDSWSGMAVHSNEQALMFSREVQEYWNISSIQVIARIPFYITNQEGHTGTVTYLLEHELYPEHSAGWNWLPTEQTIDIDNVTLSYCTLKENPGLLYQFNQLRHGESRWSWEPVEEAGIEYTYAGNSASAEQGHDKGYQVLGITPYKHLILASRAIENRNFADGSGPFYGPEAALHLCKHAVLHAPQYPDGTEMPTREETLNETPYEVPQKAGKSLPKEEVAALVLLSVIATLAMGVPLKIIRNIYKGERQEQKETASNLLDTTVIAILLHLYYKSNAQNCVDNLDTLIESNKWITHFITKLAGLSDAVVDGINTILGGGNLNDELFYDRPILKETLENLFDEIENNRDCRCPMDKDFELEHGALNSKEDSLRNIRQQLEGLLPENERGLQFLRGLENIYSNPTVNGLAELYANHQDVVTEFGLQGGARILNRVIHSSSFPSLCCCCSSLFSRSDNYQRVSEVAGRGPGPQMQMV